MAYTPTTWVQGVTTLGPTNLNHLELGLQTAAAVADAAIAKSVGTTAGDLVYFTGAGVPVRLGVGSAAQTLKGGASAPAWGTVALSELSGFPNDATKYARGDGTWPVLPLPTLEMAYVEFTTTKTATSSTETSAVTVVSAGAVTFDGSTKVRIEFFSPHMEPSDNSNQGILTLFDGNTSSPVGQLAWVFGGGSSSAYPIMAARELTPSAASHTYFVGILDGGAISAQHARVIAGSGGTGTLLPGFIRISKAA